MSAACELGHRIDNIRGSGLALYAQDENPRRTTVILTTAFRLAQYFGWREVVRIETQFLKFGAEDDTRAIAELIGSITRIFAGDSPSLNVRVTDAGAGTTDEKVAPMPVCAAERGSCSGWKNNAVSAS